MSERLVRAEEPMVRENPGMSKVVIGEVGDEVGESIAVAFS